LKNLKKKKPLANLELIVENVREDSDSALARKAHAQLVLLQRALQTLDSRSRRLTILQKKSKACSPINCGNRFTLNPWLRLRDLMAHRTSASASFSLCTFSPSAASNEPAS
jgi:hypothetical protein